MAALKNLLRALVLALGVAAVAAGSDRLLGKVDDTSDVMAEMAKGMMELKQMIERDSMVNNKALENLPAMDVSSFLDILRSVITAKFEMLSGLIKGLGGGSGLGNLFPGLGSPLLPGLGEGLPSLDLPRLDLPGLPSLG
ncbi:hypothetical protein CSUI_008719 [Cystoisospora suis]|uniref:Transmembrane protein n=1 Tax=Cystoisospora suis TaxID=483139 RepID=A0A2C6K7T5_9APIC|nr:hypothetical protein CSUI_008719 [Cystoisospora suis]